MLCGIDLRRFLTRNELRQLDLGKLAKVAAEASKQTTKMLDKPVSIKAIAPRN